jgi:hypothetical protein
MRFQSIIVSITHPSPPSGSCPGEDQHVYIQDGANASPGTAPTPVTTFRTPGDNPAPIANSSNRSKVSDAVSAGFNTAELPAASASFQAPSISRLPAGTGKMARRSISAWVSDIVTSGLANAQ